jgi:hypothetical protein
MPILKLKTEFIEKSKHFKVAMAYMDSSASDTEKDKWQPKFCKLLAELNSLEYQIRQSGCEMPDEEILKLMENVR